jgi:hypothetical protein
MPLSASGQTLADKACKFLNIHRTSRVADGKGSPVMGSTDLPAAFSCPPGCEPNARPPPEMAYLTCSFSKGEKMRNKSSLNMLPIGLLELDADGTVLYFKPDRESSYGCSAAEVVGLNLFTDIAPIAEDKEFQERIKTFWRRHAPADSFHFTFGSGQINLAAKVLLARIHEQSVMGGTDSVLIHIRPQTNMMAA